MNFKTIEDIKAAKFFGFKTVRDLTAFGLSDITSTSGAVSTPNYNGTVIITFQDNSFYSVSFRDLEFKILGITGAEKVLDAV